MFCYWSKCPKAATFPVSPDSRSHLQGSNVGLIGGSSARRLLLFPYRLTAEAVYRVALLVSTFDLGARRLLLFLLSLTVEDRLQGSVC